MILRLIIKYLVKIWHNLASLEGLKCYLCSLGSLLQKKSDGSFFWIILRLNHNYNSVDYCKTGSDYFSIIWSILCYLFLFLNITFNNVCPMSVFSQCNCECVLCFATIQTRKTNNKVIFSLSFSLSLACVFAYSEGSLALQIIVYSLFSV